MKRLRKKCAYPSGFSLRCQALEATRKKSFGVKATDLSAITFINALWKPEKT